ncbi:MAG: type II toxin-antitoxin system HicA family toxin [Geminicoccaceae bacterium]
MSKADKILSNMRRNPHDDWRVEDLIRIADRFGIPWRQPGTSHVTFAPENSQNVTVPAHKPIKPVYVRQFLAMVDSVRRSGTEEG